MTSAPTLFTAALAAGCLLSSCDRAPEPPVAPAAPPPVIERVPPAEDAELARLAAEEVELQRQLVEARLEAGRAELAAERARTAKARAETTVDTVPPEPQAPLVDTTPGLAADPADSVFLPEETAVAGDYQTFYDDLDPYGSWYSTDEYGYVWQPSVAVSDSAWRPYSLGSWVDTDYGWSWASQEPFGWACYHYGRWAQLSGCGWVWVPGDVWAPAWVSWRQADTFLGWCPLPPETLCSTVVYDRHIDTLCGLSADWYVFLPIGHFGGPVGAHCWPVDRNAGCWKTSENVTHITFTGGRVHCGGPDREWVNHRLPQPLPVVPVEWTHRPGARLKAGWENGRFTVYAPSVSARWNPALRPARTDDRWAGAKIARTSAVQADLAMRYRQEREERRASSRAVAETPAVHRLLENRTRLKEISARREALTGRSGVATVPGAAPERARPQKSQAEAPRVPVTPSPVASPDKKQTPPARAVAVEDAVRPRISPAAESRPAPAPVADKTRQPVAASRPAPAGPSVPRETRPDPRIAAAAAEAQAAREQQAQDQARQAALAEAQARARQEKARNDAQERTRQEAIVRQRRSDEQAREAAVARAREAAVAARQQQAAEQSRRTAQEQARQQEEEQQRAVAAQRRRDAEQQAARQQQEEEARSRRQAEERAREQAQEQQRREAEAQARREAQEKARQEAADRQREAQEKARRDAAEQQRREAAEQQRKAQEQARREAAEQARREAQEKQREAQEQQRRAAEERSRQEAQERARQEGERRKK